MTDRARPEVTLRFLFLVCNDVKAMRRFYVDLLGMQEANFMDTPEFGWLAVECGGVQMMWFRADAPQAVPTAFTMQPGWMGGTLEGTSWAIAVPEARWAETCQRLRAAGVPHFRPEPEWRQDSYWGLSVLDPMGTTVEVYTMPKEKPAKPAG